jgi:hypothetical protein
MDTIITDVINTLREYIPDISTDFITELVKFIMPLCDKYIEINTIHYKYLCRDISEVEHILSDGSKLTIDLSDLEITDKYAIVSLYKQPANVKGIFYILPPEMINDVIYNIIVVFTLMKLSNYQLTHNIIKDLHPVDIATVIALSRLDKQGVNTDMLKDRIHPDTVCLIHALPLSMINDSM